MKCNAQHQISVVSLTPGVRAILKVRIRASPKSAILTSPRLLMRTFSGFRSRCSTMFMCRKSRPCSNCCITSWEQHGSNYDSISSCELWLQSNIRSWLTPLCSHSSVQKQELLRGRWTGPGQCIQGPMWGPGSRPLVQQMHPTACRVVYSSKNRGWNDFPMLPCKRSHKIKRNKSRIVHVTQRAIRGYRMKLQSK